jgi:hypothetical protein
MVVKFKILGFGSWTIGEIGSDRTIMEVLQAFTYTHKGLMYTKIKSFNYNLYQRNLVYGTRMEKMGLDPDNKCSCGEIETLLHLLWECPRVKEIWKGILDSLPKSDGREQEVERCLLNIHSPGTRMMTKSLVNSVNTLVKHYLHTMRCKGTLPTYKGVVARIQKTRYLEQLIAAENGTLDEYNEKWRQLTQI